MIAALRGIIAEKTATGVVMDCGGVGYGVAMSLVSLAKLGNLGEEANILVHTHLTQEALRLYGFMEDAERQLFMMLIGTSGVGPKLALTILSTFTPDELASVIAGQDRAALTRVAGVGAKKAERLLVELKDKLPKGVLKSSVSASKNTLESDVVSALENLGFAIPVAEAAAHAACLQNPHERELAILVRVALQQTR